VLVSVRLAAQCRCVPVNSDGRPQKTVAKFLSRKKTSMHMLAGHYRSEFLATPQLVRIDYVRGCPQVIPTLPLTLRPLDVTYE
jgi:hypothetical protein